MKPIIEDRTAEFYAEHEPPQWDGPPTRIIVHRDNTPSRNATITGMIRYQIDSGTGSYHYIVKEGTVAQEVADDRQGWHTKRADIARAKGYPTTDPYGKPRGDVRALGVCLIEQSARSADALAASYDAIAGRIHVGWSPGTLSTGIDLIRYLMGKYDIPVSRIFGHSELDPDDRSYDPDKILPMARLREMLEGEREDAEPQQIRRELRAAESKMAEGFAEIRNLLRRLEAI